MNHISSKLSGVFIDVTDIAIVLIPINDCYAMLFLVEILLLMSHYIKSSSHTDLCPTNLTESILFAHA